MPRGEPPRPRIAVWMGLGAVLTALAATTWGLLRESPEEMTAEERERTSSRIRELEAEVRRLRERLGETRPEPPEVPR